MAADAHGVVTRAELLDANITDDEIRHRLDTGALLREHRGVYRVGHRAPTQEARYLAAVRACGEGAVLSGRAAAHLLRLLNGPPPPPEVTAPGRRQVEGVATRRTRFIDRRDTTTFRRIPVTTVPRTLVDLARPLDVEELARACHEAGVLYRTTPVRVEAVLERRPKSPGARKLRAVMRGEVRVTLSTLEREFQSVLREAGLPLPVTNRPAGGWRVDCHWPERKLTVELDSYRFHNSRHSWERDRQRERDARLSGDEFRRFTWTDVLDDPRFMLGELRMLLAPEPAGEAVASTLA